ncbi:hypothetical protein [Actinomadura sp. J1-007]|uniref:hypothetical protein n=1 Tax=Actinomadura sp. J1-007 TaxID=2661913 RepID=UPI001F4FCF95|nr:hypothetical protein [Actinomadura sp. J1-007]
MSPPPEGESWPWMSEVSANAGSKLASAVAPNTATPRAVAAPPYVVHAGCRAGSRWAYRSRKPAATRSPARVRPSGSTMR